MATITFNLDPYQQQTLTQALADARYVWQKNIRDCKEGLRPGMSRVGAEMILEDLLVLIAQVKEQAGA